MKTTGLVHLACVLVLILGGGCPRRPRESTRSLHEAAQSGDLKRVRSLLARGANPNKRDGYGRTPLHVATITGHAGMVRLLINNGADVDADDGDRGTPLHYAAQEGHAAVARRLIEVPGLGLHHWTLRSGIVTSISWNCSLRQAMM